MNRSDFLKLIYSLPLIYNFNKREFFFDKNYLIGKGTPKLVGKNYKVLQKWSGRPGSNRRHSAWKADALPTELLPQ